MKFSIFTVLDHHPDLPRPIGQLYAEVQKQAELADTLGFDTFWAAEHHFHQYGAAPNPAVLLAAIAARTKRIKLGPAISVLPFRNPLTVAEDYALLDQLSGGRLVMGVGSGYLKHEFAGFGVSGERKRELFDQNLDILKRAWSGESVRAGGDAVQINVRPLQQPMPPIYVAALRAEAAYFVGAQGNRLMSVPYASVDRLDDIGPMLTNFYRGYSEAGGRNTDDAALVALHTYVTESDEAARRDAASAFDRYVVTRLYARQQAYDDILRSRLGLFGSVETVVEQLVQLAGLGVRHVMLLLNFGALPPDKVEDSMRLVASEVKPRLAARLRAAAAD